MTNRQSSASRSNHEAVWVAAHFCIRRPTWIEGNGNGATDAESVAGDELRRQLEEGLF